MFDPEPWDNSTVDFSKFNESEDEDDCCTDVSVSNDSEYDTETESLKEEVVRSTPRRRHPVAYKTILQEELNFFPEFIINEQR